ncbi:probable glutamate carboxypeptidase LAMP1 isoform X2 [Rosa chinensis]|uniref:probable glutamate carboxypeptidase LAMP1 isoform X2 n=1 Tax=Rosa chinensis TaxID=74649 RepID=UPI001AD94E4A|nr:probable glutamate carboxypeptidase LAMP1 isoform X2 [Rosa chinensis]
MIIKTATAAFLAILTSFTFLLFSPTPKSSYHSLFISDSLSSNTSISRHLHTLTRRPHVAGTPANAAAAAYVLSIFTSSNLLSRITPYHVALTYPISRSLSLTPSPSSPPITFDLQQETYPGDPYADVAAEVLPTFHAFAKSGDVTGHVVYVNYGRVEDYETLKKMGVNVSGTIVLARYGEIYRGSIVQIAYEQGAVGTLVYTDRKDYGGGGGGRWFPEEKWLPPSGVQVGTVYNGIGDPTTPGWASSEECERLSDEEVEKGGDLTLIPSLPISGADGETILRAIGGQVANDDWQGSGDAPTYRVGPGPGVVHLSYAGKQVIEQIENVIGVIEGEEEPDRFVILGNHRDAWTFGAVDPNSGTAALLEIAQRLGKLQEKGWKPRRTIILCNWDAEEYGLVSLSPSVTISILYAPGFWASATPQLDELLKQATQQVKDPDNSSQTLYQAWIGSSSSPTIGRLGSGESDFAAFVQYIGIPSADMAFGKGYPVYHSMYDDFVWMEKFGDPFFHRHVAVASLWGLIALWLADAEFVPFDYTSYALELQKYMKDLEVEISDKNINLTPLFKSIEELKKAATIINNQRREIEQNEGWPSIWKKDHFKVRELNDRLMMAERAFTDQDGLFGRSWYKHLIYGPSRNDDYGSKSLPGVDEAIEKAKRLNTAESWKFVQHEVWRVARVVRRAAKVINGDLT